MRLSESLPAAMRNDVKMESAEKIAASSVKYYIEVANIAGFKKAAQAMYGQGGSKLFAVPHVVSHMQPMLCRCALYNKDAKSRRSFSITGIFLCFTDKSAQYNLPRPELQQAAFRP